MGGANHLSGLAGIFGFTAEQRFPKLSACRIPRRIMVPDLERSSICSGTQEAKQWILAWKVWKCLLDLVLLDSYIEYLSPFWIWPYGCWQSCGASAMPQTCTIPSATIKSAHTGGTALGAAGILAAGLVLVHDRLPEPSPVPAGVRVVQVPHGLFEIRGTPPDREAVRKEWAASRPKKCFSPSALSATGKISDAVRALTEVPEAFLVVAGSIASIKDKPFAYYLELADSLGVAERCRLFEGFVADADLGNYFAGTDFVLLTYSASFNSQSGVLNLAARARKPVLASASPSPLDGVGDEIQTRRRGCTRFLHGCG